VSWSEPKSRFTLLFERLVIDWIRSTGSQKAVALQLKLSWDEVHSIMHRAVRRGLARRSSDPVSYLGIDETSYRKRHRYVTVVSSLGGEGKEPRVLYVAEGRKEESLEGFWGTLTAEQKESIRAVAVDMWDPYEKSVRANLENAAEKIVYDKFHVIAHLSKAIDEVRRAENAKLRKAGDDRLKGTRYGWLKNAVNMSNEERARFFAIRTSGLRTAKAWAMKFVVLSIWDYRYAGLARNTFRRWYNWAVRSRLEPVIRVAKMMASRLDNILTYAKHRITNAVSESMNSKIQWVKYTARGFRSMKNFITAIYFHCGGLDLTPSIPSRTH
jgi:transposase